MRIRPSLTTAQLRDIQARRDPADVITLLWEIRRLRIIVMRAEQLQGSMRNEAGAVGLILSALRAELAEDAMVIEERAARAELFRRK